MSAKSLASSALHCLRMGMATLALVQFIAGTSLDAATPPAYAGDATTRTPIKHVIVIIGENRSFDHVFATYKPASGQTVWNLLSEGIVNADGTLRATNTDAFGFFNNLKAYFNKGIYLTEF